MKQRVVKRFSIMALSCFCLAFTAHAAHFSVSQQFPGHTMTITIDPAQISPAAAIDGGSFEAGRDEIAVIAPNGDIAGVGTWPAGLPKLLHGRTSL